MKALLRLNLTNNQLTFVPKELAELEALWSLHLHNNQLTAVPREFAELKALTMLYLGRNQLTALPKELGKLKALTRLYLFRNRLTAVPKELGELKALRRLDLSDNQLTALPKELAELTALTHLFLHNNTALGLPPEVLGPTPPECAEGRGMKEAAKPADILAYYFARTTGPKRPLNEAKLLFVGEGEVGKSSLVERLLYDTFTPGKAKTEGIGRDVWQVNRLAADRKPSRPGVPRPSIGANIWDLGEQEEMHATHQFFLSQVNRLDADCKPSSPDAPRPPIRANVWDFGGQEVMHATHQFFLTRRSLYVVVLAGRGGENQGRLDYWLRAIQSYGGQSPIVIVANKMDEHALEVNINRIKKDHPASAIEFFPVSCKTGDGISDLRTRLTDLIANLENVNDEVPEAYFTIKQELEAAAHAKNYLERDEYVEICQKYHVTAEAEQDGLLRFLHELGTVLNFHDPLSPYNLRDMHILNPEWVTEGVYDVLNNNGLMQAGGVFEERNLGRILKRPERYPPDKQRFIVDMMRKFEIAVDISGQPGMLLVPELLTVNEPDLNWDENEGLNFEYGYTVLPAGLIPRLIVRMIASATTQWRSGVILRHDKCKALVRGDAAKNRVRVSILGPSGGGGAQRRAALGAIRAAFREIHATVPGFKPEERVPIPGEPEVAPVPYDHLLLLEEKGLTEFIPQGSTEAYKVAELLGGIEMPGDRERRQWQSGRIDSTEKSEPQYQPRPPIEPVAPNPSWWTSLIAPLVVSVVLGILACLVRHDWKSWPTMIGVVLVIGFGATWLCLHRFKWRSEDWAKYAMIAFLSLATESLAFSMIGLRADIDITEKITGQINTTSNWIVTVIGFLGAATFGVIQHKRERRDVK